MGFSYERHITPGILLAFATVMALIPMFATGASAHAGRERAGNRPVESS
jgi:hypothetical protein